MNPAPTRADQWQASRRGALQAFHRYASWLVGISWKRFALLAVLLLVIAAITQSLPPFRFTLTEEVEEAVEPPGRNEPAARPEGPREPVIRIDRPQPGASTSEGVDISIDERGIRIRPREAAADAAGSAPEARPETGGASSQAQVPDRPAAAAEARPPLRKVQRERVVHWGDFLTDLALIWIVASAIVKISYTGRLQAEVKAAQATETAEAESLKRQVVEARMAAMQAQVEPHFLFNTLASIDHLIETDPPRASQMQKNLIALLRASMPTMREANAAGVRDLGRELAVIRPYLEILKVRMEERLITEIDVPEGLYSAEFPPMMIQSLVENAIQHGLEPKAEGGHLKVRAEVLHGKLAVSVADTGLGFGKAATAGTGVGLENIRERLQLLYGAKAQVAITGNQPSGTVVTITVPYRPVEGAGT